jgi:hypothetical protein
MAHAATIRLSQPHDRQSLSIQPQRGGATPAVEVDVGAIVLDIWRLGRGDHIDVQVHEVLLLSRMALDVIDDLRRIDRLCLHGYSSLWQRTRPLKSPPAPHLLPPPHNGMNECLLERCPRLLGPIIDLKNCQDRRGTRAKLPYR